MNTRLKAVLLSLVVVGAGFVPFAAGAWGARHTQGYAQYQQYQPYQNYQPSNYSGGYYNPRTYGDYQYVPTSYYYYPSTYAYQHMTNGYGYGSYSYDQGYMHYGNNIGPYYEVTNPNAWYGTQYQYQNPYTSYYGW